MVPVTAPADVALSWFGAAEPAAAQYGPPVWLAWQSTTLPGGTHNPKERPVLAGKGCGAQAEARGAPSERVVDARTDLEKRLSLLGVAPFHLTI